MDIRSYIRKTIGKLLAVIAWTPILYACDGLIYDGEGDCSVNYRVKFCYDYNMKFADAFAHEVNVVTLYLLDADGRVVWQRTEQGEALQPMLCHDCRCRTGRIRLACLVWDY